MIQFVVYFEASCYHADAVELKLDDVNGSRVV